MHVETTLRVAVTLLSPEHATCEVALPPLLALCTLESNSMIVDICMTFQGGICAYKNNAGWVLVSDVCQVDDVMK
jgi:hypothetical protein